MALRVRDKVTIIDLGGSPLGEGTIVNINDFREPHHKYAVDVGLDDLMFFGESQLDKQEEQLND